MEAKLKTCKICNESLPLGDFPKGKAYKDGYKALCKPCHSERNKSYYSGEEMKLKNKIYYEANKDRLLARMKVNHTKMMKDQNKRKEHSIRSQEARGRQLERDPDYYNNYHHNNKDAAKIRMKKYCGSDKGKAARNANHKKRQTQKTKAMPSWANQGYIKLFYIGAKIEAERIGEPVDVDHIVPLKHPLVCGLHCEQNLQLLIHRENLTKSNTFLI